MVILGVEDDGFAVHSKVYLITYKLAKAVCSVLGKPCQINKKIGDIFYWFGELLLSSQLGKPPNKAVKSALFISSSYDRTRH